MEAGSPQATPVLEFSSITPPCGHRPLCSRREVSRVDGLVLSSSGFRDSSPRGTQWQMGQPNGTAPAESAGREPRGHTASPRSRRRQCARCFLFLCFLSFFLLAHLGQNHCISSGGAAIIPTQGLQVRKKDFR